MKYAIIIEAYNLNWAVMHSQFKICRIGEELSDFLFVTLLEVWTIPEDFHFDWAWYTRAYSARRALKRYGGMRVA